MCEDDGDRLRPKRDEKGCPNGRGTPLVIFLFVKYAASNPCDKCLGWEKRALDVPAMVKSPNSSFKESNDPQADCVTLQ